MLPGFGVFDVRTKTQQPQKTRPFQEYLQIVIIYNVKNDRGGVKEKETRRSFPIYDSTMKNPTDEALS